MMTVALIDSMDQVDLYFLYGWNLRNMHGDGFERMIPLEDVPRPNTLLVLRRCVDG